MTETDLKRIHALLADITQQERHALFGLLRREFPIHELEREWNATAEVILEAISRSDDLTKRGIRGVIAEASFKEFIVAALHSPWRAAPILAEQPYDFLLDDGSGTIRVQVKMQRRRASQPMIASEANKTIFGRTNDFWVVETQKTRGGKGNNGESTRPYRFGEFDILAVSLHPSSNDWGRFHYTVASWLIPDPGNAACLFKFQPVSRSRNDDWTDDFLECVSWFRSGLTKRVAVGTPPSKSNV